MDAPPLGGHTEEKNIEVLATSKEVDILSLFNGKLAEAIRNCPPHFHELSEVDFVEQYKPRSVDWQLRKRFWQCVTQAQAVGITEITAASIYDDILSRQAFDVSVLPRPDRIAWMLRPMTHHLQICEEVVDIGIAKIREFLQNTPVTEKNAAQMLKLVEFCMNRTYGPVIQKLAIHQKTESISNQSRDVVDSTTPQLLMDKLSEISNKLAQSQQNVADKES